jgi:hypothetical protein
MKGGEGQACNHVTNISYATDTLPLAAMAASVATKPRTSLV